jgi:hypothetical protein
MKEQNPKREEGSVLVKMCCWITRITSMGGTEILESTCL